MGLMRLVGMNPAMPAENHVLYIDPDLSARLRFKQIAGMSSNLDTAITINTLIEALERLETRRPYRIVYVSSRFARNVVGQFIAAARRTTQGKDACYMVVLSSSNSDINTLAEYALVGADGFLLEPYSAESLAQSILLAERLRRNVGGRTKPLSIELLAKAMIDNFYSFVRCVQNGQSVAPLRESLRRTRALVETLTTDEQKRFHETLVERLILHSTASTNSSRTKEARGPKKGGFMPSGRYVRH